MRECICLAALQGGQADAGEVDPSDPAAAAVTTRGLREGTSDRRRLLHLERPGARRGTTGRCRRRWARRRPSLAWQLDDRAAPDTVPMKAVPQQCGALGRLRPALPAQSGGVVGPPSPLVPVRRVPRSGRLVQPLRSRQPVLQPHLLASDARSRPARGSLSLPALARWERPARGTLPPLAPAHRAAGR